VDSIIVNGLKLFGFSSSAELIKYAVIEKKSLIAINAEKILHATEKTRELTNNNIGYADGFGAVKVLKRNGIKNARKIPGCELWLDIINELSESKSFYLVGSRKEVIESTVAKLKADFSGINIVNYRDGYLQSDLEKQALIRDIAEKKPDVVFVAMGSPKQELLIQEMQKIHPAIYQGLGGSFDVYTGKIKRAPDWWIKNNLEWAYRMVKQPKRIKRQLHLVRFLWKLVVNRF
jgi:UDP-N-acetyl-D-mannosaminouronate:lipid I N-acetyl-D-mannosaminouronosyltransferase